MGVIKNFAFGSTPPIFKTSEESLNSLGLSVPSTPPSEAEEPQPEQRREFNPQRRDPQLLIQRLEEISRKRIGARKARREENARTLQTLVESENETCFSPTIEDFVPNASGPVMKFMTDFSCMRIWQYFIALTEEEQNAFLSSVDSKWGRKVKSRVPPTETGTQDTDDEDNEWRNQKLNLAPRKRFSLIDWRLRSILTRKRMQLDILSSVENDVVSELQKDLSGAYVSTELTNFEQQLLQGVCQYHLLKSWSIDVDGNERTKVKNRGASFCAPKVTLTQFLERRKRLLSWTT